MYLGIAAAGVVLMAVVAGVCYYATRRSSSLPRARGRRPQLAASRAAVFRKPSTYRSRFSAANSRGFDAYFNNCGASNV